MWRMFLDQCVSEYPFSVQNATIKRRFHTFVLSSRMPILSLKPLRPASVAEWISVPGQSGV